MAANSEIDYPPSTNEDSVEEEGEGEEEENLEEDQSEPEDADPPANDVADILKKLQNSGALVNKPKKEHHCYTCNEDYTKWSEFEQHLLTHVTRKVTVVVEKVQDPDDDLAPSDYDWSDEEASQDSSPPPPAPPTQTPKKMDISEILKKTGLSIKRPSEKTPPKSNLALDKLSGLGLSIKSTTSTTPIKQEKPDSEKNNGNNTNLMKKLGNLGGIKLKLKSEGVNSNSFKVVNGLKHFRTSDDEDEPKSPEDDHGDESEEEKEQESVQSVSKDSKPEDDQLQAAIRKSTDSEKSSPEKSTDPVSKKPLKVIKLKLTPKNTAEIVNSKTKTAGPKTAAAKAAAAKAAAAKTAAAKTAATKAAATKAAATKSADNTESPATEQPVKSGRPSVKQTPRRGSVVQEPPQNSPATTPNKTSVAPTTNNTQCNSPPSNIMENIVVKTEVDTDVASLPTPPLFCNQTIKNERISPPLNQEPIPATATVKTEAEPPPVEAPPPAPPAQPSIPVPLAIPKQEDTGVTIIEINGDSNDEDDDCCVVSTTPAPDVKPTIIPKSEPYSAYTSLSDPNYSSSKPSILSSRLMPTLPPSTMSQMNYSQYGVMDSKPLCDLGGKGVDDIFDSLFSTPKKESASINDASEYISLDRLGSQHTCDVCNTRFTSISMLDEHIRLTGHSKSIVTPSTNLMPYNPSSTALMSSLFPVKQLAEQVGKLSAVGQGSGAFTHQQNVMINIQAYPGSGGIVPQQPYGGYGTTAPSYQGNGQMYGQPQSMQGQSSYPGSNYMGQQGYGQNATYSSPSAPPAYPGSTASFPTSTQSPLQGMQQAIYNQSPSGMMPGTPVSMSGSGGMMHGSSGMMSGAAGMMQGAGGPAAGPNAGMSVAGGIPVSQHGAPGTMPPPGQPAAPTGGIKIKNVQTFAPGQGPIPGPIRGASPRGRGAASARGALRGRGGGPGASPMGSRVRGAGPRMQLKRPAQGSGPSPKRPSMLLPDKNDNEDCQVMAMQKQRDGLPMIQRVQGAKAPLNLGSQISITKKTVNREATAMADVLASRGIMVKSKQRSRSPSPSRAPPRIPNLGSDVSVKHASRSSEFSIPEARVGGGMYSCKLCRKMFMNQSSLSVHMSAAHPHYRVNSFKCDECPAAYPKSLQLQHHKRVFHNVTGANRELGLPVVDMSQEDNLKRLSSLGIYSFIPLANKEHASGCFGIPVISVHNANNAITNTLQALGADGLLSLGPLKPLPNS